MALHIKYEIILHWSKRDQAFIAEVPELPGRSDRRPNMPGLCSL